MKKMSNLGRSLLLSICLAFILYLCSADAYKSDKEAVPAAKAEQSTDSMGEAIDDTYVWDEEDDEDEDEEEEPDEDDKVTDFTVSPQSKPLDGIYTKSKLYTKYTKTYFMLRSYLEEITEKGGGTLTLKKGTYPISNTLYVTSKTTIILEDGVVLKKTNKVGKGMTAASSMFQLIDGAKKDKKGAYGKHNGESHITIKGKGKAVIDLAYLDFGKKAEIGIIMGHNTDVKIDNITFKNMKLGHMIEMDACKDVSVTNCTFMGFKPSGMYNKEAINIDTPDKNRQGFNSVWSKKDCTPNENVEIKKCVFKNLEAGVGTHRYSGDSYHSNVTIEECTFTNVQTAIRVLNWKDAVIQNNTFTNCKPNERYPYSFFIAGVKGITFQDNSFQGCGGSDRKLMEFWWDKGYAANQKIYEATVSEITREQAALFLTNKAENCGFCTIYAPKYWVDFSCRRPIGSKIPMP